MIIDLFLNEDIRIINSILGREKLVKEIKAMISALGYTSGHTLAFYCSKEFAKNGGLVSVFYEAVEGGGYNDPSCYLVITPDMNGFALNVEQFGYHPVGCYAE